MIPGALHGIVVFATLERTEYRVVNNVT